MLSIPMNTRGTARWPGRCYVSLFLFTNWPPHAGQYRAVGYNIGSWQFQQADINFVPQTIQKSCGSEKCEKLPQFEHNLYRSRFTWLVPMVICFSIIDNKYPSPAIYIAIFMPYSETPITGCNQGFTAPGMICTKL